MDFLNEKTKASVQSLMPSTKDVLNGAKWYVCGDSFTYGDFTGSTEPYTFDTEPYFGKNMVYPFFIGRRTGMNVINLAKCGMTMAKVEGYTNDFCTSLYQTIGEDADYITLKFGINDGHQSVPIGEINSSDDSTFYGAWNKVLNWLIANRPTAKIGIIVSNGLDSADYATATINIAKKFGILYLNEWDGEDVPVLIRSGRTDIDSSIKQIRNQAFRVTASNTHPNVACHKYESTFVEHFIRSL